MARGRGRGRGAKAKTAAKRKTEVDDEPPAKLQREESTNTKLRKAINVVKVEGSGDTKTKKYKPDDTVLSNYPKGVIHEDFTCMLNQTNIGHNNNKFYVVQVIKAAAKKFLCFTRWGRVGELGQWNFDEQSEADSAIKAFKKKFKDKTKNDWDKREDFTAHAGKYTMIEIDEESEDEDIVDGGAVVQPQRTLVGGLTGLPPCSLPFRTQIMIRLIFSDDMFKDQMSSMQLDVKKMPLGKLSKVQIAKGLETLMDIEEAIKQNKPHKVLMDLSSKFYTLVPHSFGRSTPPVMNTDSVVQQKKEVMLTLSDIELTQSLQKDQVQSSIHPVLEKYQLLDCELECLVKNDSDFKLLEEYARGPPTARRAKLLDVWKVNRKGADTRFSQHEDIQHRKLLWHGTNVAVVAAILKAGLRIMPHSGGLVGKGIYFASEYTKSAGYVCPHFGVFEGEDQVGFMFLVEVALGRESSITQSNCDLTKAPAGYDSVVARGRKEPDPKKDKNLNLDGKDVIVPVGKAIGQKEWKDSGFTQSEYLVYKESQARIRYLLKFSFK